MDASLQRLFAAADEDHAGYLTPQQLATVLLAADLNFSAAEINELVVAADTDADGRISYSEASPLHDR